MEDNLKKELEKSIKELPDIPYETAAEYEEKKDLIVSHVDEFMKKRKDIDELTGNNPTEIMEDNHQNHADFMINLFKMNQFQLLITIVPWVYRTYHNQGFSFDYFPATFKAWKEAVNNHISPELTYPIIEVYNFFEDNHNKMIELSKLNNAPLTEISPEWKSVKENFLFYLLEGDHKKCMDLGNQTVKSPEDLQNFYLQVIQHSMYSIGLKWEKGEISAAHEHLATAIVSRVMANLYPSFIMMEHTKEKAIITASPNEYHELGARMIADLLEIEGWDVDYLGANVPSQELIDLLLEDPPFLVGISVAIPFNIDKASEVVKHIKEHKKLQNTKIIVGGKTFAENPDLWKTTGADGFAVDGSEAIYLASKWWEERK